MSDNVSKIVNAFMKLSDSEKRKVIEVVVKLQRATGALIERQIIKSYGLESMENATTINFAPVPGGCPTCGK
ncbi:hypothetical protein [Pseudomonas lutea]|uniref:Uncharacterized protein n=1 Tax=Pseudomonas lutea TaxID=243924 RepID=A0A9X0JGT0_9PSED|nr:hypothetical protein [Pseudomonas lutea]KGF62072.1 hypothetical protein LT42_25230 [Pseudomonas lutea]